MKTTRYVENIQEKRVLASMILDTGTLATVVDKWVEAGLFRSPQANQLARMLVRYYRTHKKAPGVVVFNTLVDEKLDQQENELLMAYNQSLVEVTEQQEGKSYPTSFNQDRFGKHMDSVRMWKTKEIIESGIDKTGEVNGDTVTKVDALLRGKIEVGGSKRVVALDDAWLNAPEADKVSVVVEYPDEMGLFFADDLRRDGFVAFVGGPKAGKSWWLLDLAWRAVEQERRVLYFDTGDLRAAETRMRLRQRMVGKPRKGRVGKPIPIPTRVYTQLINGHLEGRCDHRSRRFKQSVKKADVSQVLENIADRNLLHCYFYTRPSVSQLLGDLENELQSGWVPDVIVVDYIDKMTPPRGMEQQPKHVWMNENWISLGTMREHNNLVVTATQTSSGGYNKTRDGKGKSFLFGTEHFSDTRTKNDEVTGMIGINRTEEEKRQGVARLNWVVRRHGNSDVMLVTAGSIEIGRPVMMGALISLE